MSRWTHVRGVIEVSSTPYELKDFNLKEPRKEDFENENDFKDVYWKYRGELDKKLYLPFPEDQFKFEKYPNCQEWNNHKLYFTANIYSLPRAIKYIEKACNLLPSNEFGFIKHSVDQNDTDSSTWIGDLDVPCLKNIYEKAVVDLFSKQQKYSSTSFSGLKHYFNALEEPSITFESIQEHYNISSSCSINYIENITITIKDDLRRCSGEQFKEGFIKFLHYLASHEIFPVDGYIEWEDEYDVNKRYAWRKSCSGYGYMSFFTLNAHTNEIITEERYYCSSQTIDNFTFDIKVLSKEDLLKEKE